MSNASVRDPSGRTIAGLDTDVLLAKLEEEDAAVTNLIYGFVPLLFNYTTRKGKASSVPSKKAPPSLESFKGKKFPDHTFENAIHSNMGMAHACMRFYWSKKGSYYGLLLFFLQGALPPASTIFLAQMTSEMQHPDKKRNGILILHGGLLLGVYLLHTIVNWFIVHFKKTWGLAGALIMLFDAQFFKMDQHLQKEWTPTKAILLFEAAFNANVSTFLGDVMYTFFSGICSFAFMIALAIWHMKGHAVVAIFMVLVILVDVFRRLPHYRLQLDCRSQLAHHEAAARTLALEYFQARIRRGRLGDDKIMAPEHAQIAFATYKARKDHLFYYSKAHHLFEEFIQHAIAVAFLIIGGVGVIHDHIKLEDLTAMISMAFIAGKVGEKVADAFSEITTTRPVLAKIIHLLNMSLDSSTQVEKDTPKLEAMTTI